MGDVQAARGQGCEEAKGATMIANICGMPMVLVAVWLAVHTPRAHHEATVDRPTIGFQR